MDHGQHFQSIFSGFCALSTAAVRRVASIRPHSSPVHCSICPHPEPIIRDRYRSIKDKPDTTMLSNAPYGSRDPKIVVFLVIHILVNGNTGRFTKILIAFRYISQFLSPGVSCINIAFLDRTAQLRNSPFLSLFECRPDLYPFDPVSHSPGFHSDRI